MLHHGVRHVLPVPHREYRLLLPAEVELHYDVTAVAGHSPAAGCPGRAAPASRRQRRGDDGLWRIVHEGELRARGAAPRRLTQVRRAHAPTAVRARHAMALAHALSAYRTRRDFISRKQNRRLLGAGGPVPPADQTPRRLGAAEMLGTVHLPVHGAAGLMGGADRLATARALRHLVHAHPLVAAAFT